MKNSSLLILNPGCGTCRTAKDVLLEKNISFEELEYLKTGLSEEILKELPDLLKMDYPEMIRTKEPIYIELQLRDKKLKSADWIQVLKDHPVLLERPIFIHKGKAVIGRPAEKVLELL